VVDRVMQGYNGTIFCYGITGSGKTYTMSGPPPEPHGKKTTLPEQARAQGIVQRSASRIFEYIRDRSGQGEVFSVEASFLEIYSSDGVTEQLMDLLASGKGTEAKLEMRRDPLNGQAFVCSGLTSVPICSPDEMCEVLEAGRQRCTFMETSRNCHSSRSHCLFHVAIECLADKENDAPVRRGKLMLVDLAGSESLKKVVAANETDEELRRRQAIGINRVLSNLGAVVNNLNAGNQNAAGFRNSALTMLLRDCLGGSARAMLIANIGPEADWCSETFMTLGFAQKMMQVRNVEKATFIDRSQSSLVQMRQRHLECIQRLQESSNTGAEAEGKEKEEWQKLQQEVQTLNGRILTKDTVTETLEKMQAEQGKKIEELRTEMTQVMASKFADLQEQSVKELEELRQVIEDKTREGGEIVERRQRAVTEAQLDSLQGELNASVERHKAAASNAAQLRTQLSAMESRVQMLQDLQKDLMSDRDEVQKEQQALRQQVEDKFQRVVSLGGEVQQHRIEANLVLEQIEQMKAARAAEVTAAHAEREAWSMREAALKASRQAAREKLNAQRASMGDSTKAAQEGHRASLDELRGNLARLEAQATVEQKQLRDAQAAQAALEAEVSECQEREASYRAQVMDEQQLYEDDLQQVNASVEELTVMLQDLQGSIMQATTRKSTKK